MLCIIHRRIVIEVKKEKKNMFIYINKKVQEKYKNKVIKIMLSEFQRETGLFGHSYLKGNKKVIKNVKNIYKFNNNVKL